MEFFIFERGRIPRIRITIYPVIYSDLAFRSIKTGVSRWEVSGDFGTPEPETQGSAHDKDALDQAEGNLRQMDAIWSDPAGDRKKNHPEDDACLADKADPRTVPGGGGS